jgi:ankyrin repeat protein
MDMLLKPIESLDKILPLLQSLPLWARYIVSIWTITTVMVWAPIFVYWLLNPDHKSNEAPSKQTGTETVQEQTVQHSPGSTNIQARDIIIHAPTPPVHPKEPNTADSARRELGRLNVPYSVAAFLSSAQEGDATAVRLLIEAGMNVNIKTENYGSTPLMVASAARQLSIVDILIQKKAMVNMQDDLGDTALIIASSKGHLDVVQVLLNKGAEPNIQNVAGRTALRVAAENGHTTVVLALLKQNVDLEVRDKDENKTPLLAAAMHHHTQVVKILLDSGADPKVRDKYGHSPLIPAARSGNVEMVKSLISYEAEINAADKDGRTPLMGASVNGHPEVVALLLEHNADITLTDKDGKTALMWAEKIGHKSAIDQLRKAADVSGM